MKRSQQRSVAGSEVEDFQAGCFQLIVPPPMAATYTRHLGAPSGDGAVRERALQLGPEGELVGVLAAPAEAPPPGARPVVVFLNAGVIHRVGPHRLHVILARRLAARGVTSLRLDLSGIGDSRALPGALSFRQSAVADTQTAMDWLAAETGARRFVLFGLCSGADNALATAAADARVAGIVIVDPPAYVTPRARARKLARRFGRVRSIDGVRELAAWGARAVTRRVVARLSAVTALRPPAPPPPPVDDPAGVDQDGFTGGRELPSPAAYRAQLAALVDRGVGVLAVYSGALGDRYNHEDQLFELFPELRGRVDRAYFPTANHTFTELAAQAALATTVTGWIDGRR